MFHQEASVGTIKLILDVIIPIALSALVTGHFFTIAIHCKKIMINCFDHRFSYNCNIVKQVLQTDVTVVRKPKATKPCYNFYLLPKLIILFTNTFLSGNCIFKNLKRITINH